MQQISGAQVGGSLRRATPEEKALHLLQVWLERDEARRANPDDRESQRNAHMALRDLRDQACRVRSSAKQGS